MKILICFERIIYIRIICMGRGSCFSRNVSLTIQIWMGTPSIEWRCVSVFHAHRSATWCPNPLSQHFRKCDRRGITCILETVFYYEALIRK